VSPEVWWYLSRASALVAYAMLTVSVLWGAALASGRFRARRAWLLDLHRGLGVLTIMFVAGHLATLLADSTVGFRLVDFIVPFASEWRPRAVAFGVAALWLVLAVEVTSLLLRRVPRRWWRGVHVTAYIAFWLTSVHGALAGTDSARLIYIATSSLAVAAVALAASYRILARRRPRTTSARRERPAGPVPASRRVFAGEENRNG
jgi:DMSO/TMAO reductase YedYZ heme-binding membrane subunit